MTKKQIIIASKLNAMNPEKAKAILAKLSFEQTESAGCSWKCAGHNVIKHNKKY